MKEKWSFSLFLYDIHRSVEKDEADRTYRSERSTDQLEEK